jgi:hypothetical protein
MRKAEPAKLPGKKVPPTLILKRAKNGGTELGPVRHQSRRRRYRRSEVMSPLLRGEKNLELSQNEFHVGCRFSFICRKRAWRRTFIPLPV